MTRLKNQKSARASAPKNRYCAGAKLSEHKFLRLLHGYAHGVPLKQLEPTTHVSGKTIRGTYRAFRLQLPEAAQHHPDRFGGAGVILASESRDELIESVKRSPRFRRHRAHHAPRMKCLVEEHALATEKLIRLICALDLRAAELDEANLRALAEGVRTSRPRDSLQQLIKRIPGANLHRHPQHRLYHDYRRFLLKCPLG